MKKIMLSERIRDYRKQNNMSQEKFGKLLNVTPQAVSKWERDECYPDITFLPRLAELLNCSVNDFFC
ncbi:MAG: helix-turn-helix transcriptional regulator [Clostridia bacterium]|nr:helix-turn-helix transcriptional regulator [Clostridia bacterium]